MLDNQKGPMITMLLIAGSLILAACGKDGENPDAKGTSEGTSAQVFQPGDPGKAHIANGDIVVTTTSGKVPGQVTFQGPGEKSLTVEISAGSGYDVVFNCADPSRAGVPLGTYETWTLRPRFGSTSCQAPGAKGTIAVSPNTVQWDAASKTASITYVHETDHITIQLQNVIEGGGIDG